LQIRVLCAHGERDIKQKAGNLVTQPFYTACQTKFSIVAMKRGDGLVMLYTYKHKTQLDLTKEMAIVTLSVLSSE
jgi:hypothetical protein